MLNYVRVFDLDDELYDFHLRQENYYRIAKKKITREYLLEDMKIPDGFDKKDHYIEKCYLDNELVGLIDYQYGYRFSMIHDEKCVWIGLFLIDQNKQYRGLGTQILNECLQRFKKRCNRVQLACLLNNRAGLKFWQKQKFTKIGDSMYGDLPLIVLERKISR